jgi:predicted  nucleic acid-binding Zn-ribbon protein
VTEHDERAEDLEQELEDMQERSERLEDEISDTREDWERKQRDDSVPGAVGEPEDDDED